MHFIIVIIRWTCLAPWELKFPFPSDLTSTFLVGLCNTALERKSMFKPPKCYFKCRTPGTKPLNPEFETRNRNPTGQASGFVCGASSKANKHTPSAIFSPGVRSGSRASFGGACVSRRQLPRSTAKLAGPQRRQALQSAPAAPVCWGQDWVLVGR